MSTPTHQTWDLPSPPASTVFSESWRMAGYHPLSPQEAPSIAFPSPHREPNSEGFTSPVMADSAVHMQSAPALPWSPQMQYSSFAHTPVQECAYLPSPVSVSTSPFSPKEFKSFSPADDATVFQPQPMNNYMHSALYCADWQQPLRQPLASPHAGFLSPHLSLSSSSRSSSSLSSAGTSYYPGHHLPAASTPPLSAKASPGFGRATEPPEASSRRLEAGADSGSGSGSGGSGGSGGGGGSGRDPVCGPPSSFPADQSEDNSKQPPYAIIIYDALMSVPDKRMVLADIYNYFRWRMPARAARDGGWKNSIRHNLSMNGVGWPFTSSFPPYVCVR